jgi:hypothetical protein
VKPPPRDRDPAGRARNSRLRDDLGRPLPDRATLASDPPALAPADALSTGQRLLDAGRPFAAHEVFEAVWKATADPERDLWRGLAQLAVGITHALRDNPAGARSLLARAAATLAAYRSAPPYDIDVDGLIRWADQAAVDPALASAPPRLMRG